MLGGTRARKRSNADHVKEGEMLLLLEDFRKLLPLFMGRVDSGGVMSAGVKEDDASLRSGLITDRIEPID
jgi:hypothetical protein